VPFSQYGTDPLTQAAAADLAQFPYFQQVTADTLFRGETPGDRVGPYLSQFLWRDVPYGASKLTQLCRTTVAGDNYLTGYADWLKVQNGLPAAGQSQFDPVSRYIRNGRDLAEWVRRDFPYQAFLNATLILLSFGANALDDGNPYKSLAKQAAFVTFGAPDVLSSVAQVAGCALKAAWFQKWSLHRRLRPEEFAGRVHNHLTGAARYPLPPALLNATVLTRLLTAYGGYLLPMAYPDGCPAHPAYPAGHATIAGACATLLKAFFDESFVIPNPQVADDDGLALTDYLGPPLTVGGELNKLAANISLGRDTAGVHWRSDGIEGMQLGETVALRYLQDMRATYHEAFAGFALTRFDGTVITV
jgi:membrane-associated phospholipid phosphatase